MCWMHQEEGFKFCLDTKKKKALPLELACPEHLSVQSSTDLPYKLCYSCYLISDITTLVEISFIVIWGDLPKHKSLCEDGAWKSFVISLHWGVSFTKNKDHWSIIQVMVVFGCYHWQRNSHFSVIPVELVRERTGERACHTYKGSSSFTLRNGVAAWHYTPGGSRFHRYNALLPRHYPTHNAPLCGCSQQCQLASQLGCYIPGSMSWYIISYIYTLLIPACLANTDTSL
jgi:hypothetical protein